MTKRLLSRDDVDLTSDSYGLDEEDLKRHAEWFRQNESNQRKKRSRIERLAKKRDEDKKRRLLKRKEELQRKEDEIRYGPRACDWMKNAYENGVEHDNSTRINVIGTYKQGKSSLVKALVGSWEKSIYSTNGIEIASYKCRKDARTGKIIYDKTPGYDLTDIAKRTINARKSEPKNVGLMQKIGSFVNKTYKKLLIWRTNNPENLPDDMTEEERDAFIQAVKQKEENNVSEDDIIQILDVWDFAGQMVFYATHTLFHSRRAVYLLVFKLSVGLSEFVLNNDEECRINHGKRTMEYYIRFWVNSVHSFVGNKDGTEPIIILVGTHLDKLKGNDTEKIQQAEDYFDKIRVLFKGKQASKHFYEKEFALNAKEPQRETLNDLRDTLQQLGEGMSWSRTVPAKWIQLEKCLYERRHEKIVKFSTVVEIDAATKYPLKDKDHIKLFLKDKHDQGKLVYFDEEPISQFVVLDPQFLVDAFKCLITAKRSHITKSYDQWLALSKEGKLENTLIDKLWTSAGRKDFMKHKDTILWFLQKHRIISQAMRFDEASQEAVGLGWYVVPSLLPDHARAEKIRKFQRGKVQTRVQYVISFDNSAIVQTVYHRLIAAVLGKWSVLEFDETKLLFDNLSIVQMDSNHAGAIRLNDRHIHLSLMTLTRGQSIDRSVADGFRRYAESVIMYEFRKHQGVTEHEVLPFTRAYSCNNKKHNPNGSTNIKVLDTNLNIDTPSCPDLHSHIIATSCATAEWFQGNESLENIPPGCPSCETLAIVSQHVSKNWEILATRLGIPKSRIDHIKADEDSMCKQILEMLLEWRETKEENISLNDIIQALQRLPRVRVNWDGIRNLVDEINGTTSGSSAI